MPMGPPQSSFSPSATQALSPDIAKLDVQLQKISVQDTRASSSGNTENRHVPMKRPDVGTVAIRRVNLLVNHFPVKFNPNSTIMHYDVDVKQVKSDGNQPLKKLVPRAELRMIRDKLFSDDPDRFPMDKTAYDGKKNIFSAVPLPEGQFRVELSDGEDAKTRSYAFTVKLVNELKLSKLKDYLSGNPAYIPRDILQGMDLVMKENPSRNRIALGRSFYSTEYNANDDLRFGLAAHRGFHQSLKPTSQGLSLCLDYSVLAFRKQLMVIDFLTQHISAFKGDIRGLSWDNGNLWTNANDALKGLKVRVTHRRTKQKYTIVGLTRKATSEISFDLVDEDGKQPPRKVSLFNYFREKYGMDIKYKSIPCLDLGKNNRTNYVPLEFCVLVEGQRFPKEQLEQLDRDAGLFLRQISLLRPHDRKHTIDEMVRSRDGPSGTVSRNFDLGIDNRMTSVVGRVVPAPDLKLGSMRGNFDRVTVDRMKCQWNLTEKTFVEGKSLERWALVDFSAAERNPRYRLDDQKFVYKLKGRCQRLRMHMEDPLVSWTANMHLFNNTTRLEELLRGVVEEASKNSQSRLQMIVCVMARKHNGYKHLKWFSETQIGVITQCCLSDRANNGNDQYFANLCLKINAKLGGSNVELNGRLPHFNDSDRVMFIGADVNHPGSRNTTCPSIAAIVGTMNWPAANRYAARVCPQRHRSEKILNFGAVCAELVKTYAKLNKFRPNRIIVFRDGVSEGQFDMVLNEELVDLLMAITDEHYRPTITLVVAQKRHQTRLFLDEGRNGVNNVPPGTVVDTTIVHPFEFDFYLCSHFGGLGTSKPTHYYVLWDQNNFTSDDLQKLIYDMCFTFARCTKPVSLVPPVYYADLVAYRGRMFQEVVMQLQNPASPSSSIAASASSSSWLPGTASFDQSFYSLHPDLKDVMFFV